MPVRPAMPADSSPISASEAMRRWSAADEPLRILLVARWPIGAVRAHLLTNYSALCAAGFRFTFVGPAGEAFDRLRTDFDGIEGLEFAAAPVEGRRCRLWPTIRALLCDRRYGLVHSHGFTAAVHATLANFGIAVPHLVTLHKPLHPNQFPGWIGCLKRWVLKRALHEADAIVTVSEEARVNLLEHVPSLRSRAHRLFIVADDVKAERLTTLLRSLTSRMLSPLPSEPIAA
jgi:glycosyltransferase involved in cell wall biosynthesis